LSILAIQKNEDGTFDFGSDDVIDESNKDVIASLGGMRTFVKFILVLIFSNIAVRSASHYTKFLLE